MLRKLQVVVLFLVIPFGMLYFYADSKNITIREIFLPGTPIMHIGEIPLRVEIAETDAALEKGLSGRAKFPNVNGMLFIFNKPDYHGIWMKDMHFPIDVIWIDENLKVVGITKGITPESYPKTFRPPVPVKYVVETDVNYADTFGIHEGHSVRLPLDHLQGEN